MDLERGSRGQAKAGEREAPMGMAGGAGADTGSSDSGAGAAVGEKPIQQAGLAPDPSPGQKDKLLTSTVAFIPQWPYEQKNIWL